MHIEQKGDPAYRTKYQARFPRDANGRYSPASSAIPTPIYTPLDKPSFKYCQQARFCLGCAAIELLDGRIMGKRSYVFDYTDQRLVSIGEYDRRVRDETNWVKSLKIEGRRSKWVKQQPKIGRIHDQDDISSLPRVGINTKTHQSMSQRGIKTIDNLKRLFLTNSPLFMK